MQIPVSSINYKGRDIDILRLDMANLPIGGNKYYKLKYNLEKMKAAGIKTVLTFGGAFSNHICTLAIACSEFDISGISVIRGEDDRKNPILNYARSLGMQLYFITREEYKNKETTEFLRQMKKRFGDFFHLPEGGTNSNAVKGCSEILSGRENVHDLIFCPVGTGGTLAGLISTPGLTSRVIGVSVLRGEDQHTEKIKCLLKENEIINSNWEIDTRFHLGGYAKYNPELIDFITWFQNEFGILADPVYTGKMFYSIFHLIDNNYLSTDKKIMAIHTGGLMGWEGWQYRFEHQSPKN